ncbi:11194_t:CDS:2, partial [Acaulospora colombiana]
NPYQAPGTTENLCVLAMLSPYPTPSISDLDDFLALKLENEQLARRIEDIKSGHLSDESFGEDSDENLENGEGRQDTIVDKSERALAQAQAVLGAATATNNQPTTSSAYSSGAQGELGADGLPPKKKVSSTVNLVFIKPDVRLSDGSLMPNKVESALRAVETILLNGERVLKVLRLSATLVAYDGQRNRKVH